MRKDRNLLSSGSDVTIYRFQEKSQENASYNNQTNEYKSFIRSSKLTPKYISACVDASHALFY